MIRLLAAIVLGWAVLMPPFFTDGACTAEFDNVPDPKKRFDDLARKELGRESFESVSSGDILATQLRRLATMPADHPDLLKLHQRLAKAAGS